MVFIGTLKLSCTCSFNMVSITHEQNNFTISQNFVSGVKMSYNMPDVGPGRRMKYPYTTMGKLFHFPWKWSWKYGRGYRFLAYSLIITFPLIYKIDRAGQYIYFVFLNLNYYLSSCLHEYMWMEQVFPRLYWWIHKWIHSWIHNRAVCKSLTSSLKSSPWAQVSSPVPIPKAQILRQVPKPKSQVKSQIQMGKSGQVSWTNWNSRANTSKSKNLTSEQEIFENFLKISFRYSYLIAWSWIIIFLGFYIVLYETEQNKAELQIALLLTVALNVKFVIELS